MALTPLEKKDPLTYYFGLAFMDDMHEYPSPQSNIRYYHRLKARIVEKFIQKNASFDKVFLDAGAGHGPYCAIAAPLYQNVYCDEFDMTELAVAESFLKEKKNISFYNHDLTHTTYADSSINHIICSEVLEHIPTRLDAARELYRILKPGGSVLISMPQRNSLFYKHVKKVHKKIFQKPEPDPSDPAWHFVQHVNFSAKDIRQIVTDAGFTIIDTHGANVLPVGEKIFSFMYKNPSLLNVYCTIELLLEKVFPSLASFYFVEATKK